MMNKPLFLLACACAVSASFLLQACSKSAPSQEPVRAVKVFTVGALTYGSSYEYSGEIRARIESNVGFRVGGKVISRQVQLGQSVKAGQVLAQLDPQDLKLAAGAARAMVAAALSSRDLVAADYKRYKELKEQNFISSAEFERREAALKAAQAQLDQAQAQLTLQGNQAAYAVLLADAPGVVTAVDVEVGQVVAAGVPVLRIARDGPRDVVFSVPEDRLSLMQLGGMVQVKVWTQEMVGTVREIAASPDPLTRTYAIRATLNQAPALGATASVKPQGKAGAQLTGKQVITVPTTALHHDGKSSAVWVLDLTSMTLKSVPVQVSTADGNQAVIAAGLQPGMVVVSTGVHVLSSGQKVVIYKEKSAQYVREYGDEATGAVAGPNAGAAR